MKKHITWLLVVTGFFILIVISVICMEFWYLIKAVFLDGNINKIVVENYFENDSPHSLSIVGYVFIIIKIALNAYFLMLLVKAFQFLKKMRSGEIIFKNQSQKIQFVGSGIIAYASIKYALFVLFGVLFFSETGVIIKGISNLFLFYVIGKLLLLAASVSLKAEDYKTENELTV